MKYCTSCGAQINDSAKFCGSCGAKQEVKINLKKATDTPQQEIYPDRSNFAEPSASSFASSNNVSSQAVNRSTAQSSPIQTAGGYTQSPQQQFSQPQPVQMTQPSPQPAQVQATVINNNIYTANSQPPALKLSTTRGLVKLIIFSLFTLGIYSIVYFTCISTDINTIAGRYDGKKTMHFCLLAFIVAPLTLGIGAIVWYHNLSERIGTELRRRGCNYSFSAADFWIYYVLLSFIIIGPFIYLHRLSEAMNLLSADYNARG